MSTLSATIQPIKWSNNRLELLDQRLLPFEEKYLICDDVQAVANAIREMVVRGAPAIGITAAYGIVLAARARFQSSLSDWKQKIESDLEMLSQARPTAVNLDWAIKRMRNVIADLDFEVPDSILLAEAERIHEEDIAACQRMGNYGAELIKTKCNILTHCNTGALATGGYGTALGVIRSAFQLGKIKQVYADETRPWLQGARLTAWELVKENIPVTLIADSAAGHLMEQGTVKWVIVGADRIAANGDVANKIGTYTLAVLAQYHNVKFMVVAPTTTVDMNADSGNDIPIEQRSPDEILSFAGQPVATTGAEAWNPAFDITPANLIDAIVTEKGVVMAPDVDKMADMIRGAS